MEVVFDRSCRDLLGEKSYEAGDIVELERMGVLVLQEKRDHYGSFIENM